MNFIKTCESIFNEVQQMRHDVMAGKISVETYAMQMAGIAQLEKQQKLMIHAHVAQIKSKKQIGVSLNRAITAENEMLSCPDQDGKFITREMCLDYSGEHMETCQSCKNFRTTRKLLIDN